MKRLAFGVLLVLGLGGVEAYAQAPAGTPAQRGKTPPKTDSGVRLITAKVVKGGQILKEPAGTRSAWVERRVHTHFAR